MQLLKKLEVVVDIKKECGVSESMGDTPSKSSLIFPLPVEESNPDLLISYEGVGWI